MATEADARLNTPAARFPEGGVQGEVRGWNLAAAICAATTQPIKSRPLSHGLLSFYKHGNFALTYVPCMTLLLCHIAERRCFQASAETLGGQLKSHFAERQVGKVPEDNSNRKMDSGD